MSDVPADLKYVDTHEWLRAESDGNVTIGITDHAQDALGDVVFVDAPEIGRVCSAGEACAVVESVKAASDIYCPIAGTIVAVNGDLSVTPELLNQEPYGKGWLFRVKPGNIADLGGLLDSNAYQRLLEQAK